MEFDIVKVTSRGQIVIPKSIRVDMGIEEGEKFLAYDREDTIVLKRLLGGEEGEAELEDVFAPLWKKAKEKGLTKADVEGEIKAYREEKRK